MQCYLKSYSIVPMFGNICRNFKVLVFFKIKMKACRCLTFVVALIVFGVVESSEITVHECACIDEQDCFKATSDIWTTFNFDKIDGEGSDQVPVRLQRGKYACSPKISETILVNVSDPANKLGYNGAMYGVRGESGDSVTFQINDEGILVLLPDLYQGYEELTRESYCIRRLNASYSSIEICCGLHNSCIRKCCPYGYSFTNNMSDPCHESVAEGWNLPQMLSTATGGYYMEQDSLLSKSKIRTGFPDCQPYNITDVVQNFKLYSDGTLKIVAGEGSSPNFKWKSKPENISYCIDSLTPLASRGDEKCGVDSHRVIIICREPYIPKSSPDDWTYRIIYISGFCIAISFLLSTAMVHIILWEKQNVHAVTILCYVSTLTGFYICLLVIYIDETRKRFSNPYTPFIQEEFCPILGMITHSFGIASFAWLSVINFDLWWTFRVLKPMNQRSFDLKRLLCYAGFAVTVTVIILSISVSMQFRYLKKQSEACPNFEEDYAIYPRYGVDGCFLSNSSQPYYFYTPVGLLLLVNLVFYLFTSCQMLRIYNATRRISSDRAAKNQKQSYHLQYEAYDLVDLRNMTQMTNAKTGRNGRCELFLKLFLVMGISWISQVILAIFESGEQHESRWYTSIFITILDLVNLLQAIAIFVIFVCKRETLRALEQKIPCFRTILKPFSGFYRTQTILGRSTDGSYKMSRTELTKHNSIESSSGSGDHHHHHRHSRRAGDRDSELISFS